MPALRARHVAPVRWALLAIALLAAILVPFFLFEPEITSWTQALLESERSRWIVGALLGLLLASDVLLPIPSSLISTGCGYLLGALAGTLISWLGMTIGAIIGYAVGAKPAKAVTAKAVGDDGLTQARAAHSQYGDWSIIVSRAVPVLAEASVILAGVAGMPFRRFFALTASANLAISGAYATVGAFSMAANSFLLAFVGAILLPGLLMLVLRRRRVTSVRP